MENITPTYSPEKLINVTEVTGMDIAHLLGALAKGPDLGDADAETKAAQIFEKIKNNSKKTFLLKWQGSRVPTGAKIDGMEIKTTQHGVIMDVNDSQIGTYERVLDTDGEQQMLVYI
ncbi:MAG: hypothetical protein JWM20_783 [Patescibacteria group bacterium]|nr:hypothetical protein [Patescibacteria group bacterium]